MSGSQPDPTPEIVVDGRRYGGWTELRVTRGIERCAGDFVLQINDRWPGEDQGWPLRPFQPCEIRFGEDLVITGHIDAVQGSKTGRTRTKQVKGRSRTADLVDCSALLEGQEFRNSTLVAICNSVGRPFGVEAVDEAGIGRVVIPQEAADKTETCFRFLERLARGASVLLTDDPQGRLVIARTGTRRAAGRLVEGENLLGHAVELEVDRRFSHYVVKGQLPAAAAWIDEEDRNPGETVRPGSRARPQITGEVRDPAVPRYRPFVLKAEGNADGAAARARAIWQQRRDAARSLQVKVNLHGWRQPDGRLWTINELVPVSIPSEGVEAEMLVASVSQVLSLKEGRQTILTLGLPDAYTPEPAPAERGNGGGTTAGGWVAMLPQGGGRAP